MKADAQASTFAVGVGIEKLKAADVAGAIERFREAIRLAPDNPRAHHQLALALERAGQRAEAQRALRRSAAPRTRTCDAADARLDR